MDAGVIVPIGLFAAIAAIVWSFNFYSSRNRAKFHETVRAAIEQGRELSPETIKLLGAPPTTKHADIKWGAIWIAAAAACLVAGWAGWMSERDAETLWMCVGIAAFPGFLGITLLGYGLVMLRADRD
jgi:hypothetical protein